MATAVRVALSLSWKRPACICHDQRFTLPFPVGSCFARTLSASRRRENQRYGLNKYSAALCASANSAFSFDVNHLNAESAETQRTAEKEKCSSPTQSRCCPHRHLTPDATTCSNCQRKTLPRKQNCMHLQCRGPQRRRTGCPGGHRVQPKATCFGHSR